MSHSSPEELSVLVLDRQDLAHKATCAALHTDCSVTAYTTHKSTEAVVLAQTVQPDVILLDLGGQNSTGLEGIHQMLGEHTDASILVCSDINALPALAVSLDVGATAYLAASPTVTHFILALRQAYGAKLTADPEVAHHLFRTWHQHSLTPTVTGTIRRTPMKILVLAWQGCSNRSADQQLRMSENALWLRLRSHWATAHLVHRTQLTLRWANTELLHLMHYVERWMSRSWRMFWQVRQRFTSSPSVDDSAFASTKTGSHVRPFHRLST